MEDFKKFSKLKEEQTTASGGTEQYAAHSLEHKEQIKKAENEIIRLQSENKELGKMYANTHAKLRDLQKEFSDTKANLHRAYNGLENYSKTKHELTRLRSELQDTKSYYEDKLDARQRTIDQQFSELQQAKQEIANHIAVNSLLTDSEGEADLANKLYKATSELQQERDFRKELVEGLESVIRLKALIEYPQNTKEKHIGEAMAISGMLAKVESLIKKAKNN